MRLLLQRFAGSLTFNHQPGKLFGPLLLGWDMSHRILDPSYFLLHRGRGERGLGKHVEGPCV